MQHNTSFKVLGAADRNQIVNLTDDLINRSAEPTFNERDVQIDNDNKPPLSGDYDHSNKSDEQILNDAKNTFLDSLKIIKLRTRGKNSQQQCNHFFDFCDMMIVLTALSHGIAIRKDGNKQKGCDGEIFKEYVKRYLLSEGEKEFKDDLVKVLWDLCRCGLLHAFSLTKKPRGTQINPRKAKSSSIAITHQTNQKWYAKDIDNFKWVFYADKMNDAISLSLENAFKDKKFRDEFLKHLKTQPMIHALK